MFIIKNKAFYICFYANNENKDKYVTFPSAWNKVDYVVSRIIKCGYSVDLLSAARIKAGKWANKEKQEISSNETHYYFSSSGLKGRLCGKLVQYWINLQIIRHVVSNYKKNDVVVAYHSLYYCFAINVLKKIFRKKVVMQIEEVYSYTDIGAARFKNKENKYLLSQEKFICINELVQAEFAKQKPSVIAYGDYRLCPNYSVKSDSNKIRLVYAGVIEQQRKAAFIASETLLFLPKNYELHIMGFGTQENINALTQKVIEVNKECGRDCVFYDGHFSGEDYFRKLQANDIALSTHIYDSSDADSSRYMFSSKILSYLNNNLPVVAQRLECLENSKVSDLLHFYQAPKPELIANVIKGIDIKDDYDTRTVVKKLDEAFVSELKDILAL